jgi:succinate dehydrogenase (ubiquinone) membrane anchor subunit
MVRHGDPAHGSVHWNFERLLALGFVPLFMAPFAAGSLNPALDATLCAAILVHSHMGLGNIVEDYVPKRRFPKSRRLCDIGLGAVTLLVGYGLYEFETNDVGLTEGIKRVWKA